VNWQDLLYASNDGLVPETERSYSGRLEDMGCYRISFACFC